MSAIFSMSARRRRACPGLALALLLPWVAAPAWAIPGSGAATFLPAGTVPAGAVGTWTIDYRAAEDFRPPDGGVVGFVIPAGWTPPSVDPIVGPGHVVVTGPAGAIDSVRTNGMEVWVYGGSVPGTRIRAGDHIVLEYGAPLPAGAAQAQTTPGLVTFLVLSDPDGAAPAPLTAGSPEVQVGPAAPEELHFIPATLALVAGTPAPIRLETRDRFGNPSPVAQSQLLSLTAAAPGFVFLVAGAPVSEATLAADSSGVLLSVMDTAVGGALTFRAADGDATPPSLLPALGQATVSHGPPAGLVVTGILHPIVAGEAASVTVEVRDAYGNRATTYDGTVRFASTDAGPDTQLPATYTFQPADAGRHVFAGEVVLTVAGMQTVSAEDDADPQISGEQSDIVVTAAETVELAVSDISDPTTAGTASDVEVAAQDRYGNRTESYVGTVHFSSDDPHPGATLPSDYTFAASESGVHRFPNGVVLMTAGGRNVAASDIAVPTIAGAQPGIDVTAGPAAAGVFTPAGTVPVTAGATQVIVLTVTDQAGNAVAGEPATIAILDVADGALAPDPGHPGGTYGTGTVQSGATDVNGDLTVRFVAPPTAGVSDRLGAWTATLPAGAIAELELVIVADGATRLALAAPVLADTAFAAFALTAVAEDSYGNLDPDATPLVRLTADSPSARFSLDGGGSWSQGPADSLVLAGGTSGNLLRVRDPAAGTVGVTAADAAGFLAPANLALTVTAAPPAGVIPLLVLPDTLTADGRSEAQVVGGPVSDRYSNPVARFPVTVATTAGEVRGVDEDPAPGVQRRTDADGRFVAGVRAADFPADAQLTADTAPGGTAAGSAAVTFLPRPRFGIAAVAPPSAVPGDSVAFQITVQNLGPSAVVFGGGTVLRLLDPDGSSLATTLAGPIAIEPGAGGDLLFQPVTIDTALAPGRYTPWLRLAGTDARGAAVDTLIAAPFESFAIEVLAIEAVLAPSRVSRGQANVPVEIVARNRGASSLLVTALGLDFSQPAYQVGNPSPPLPHALGPGAQLAYTVLVQVDPLAVLGPVAIDARLEFEAGGAPRLALGAATPTQWTVVEAADLAYVAGSLAPRIVSVGQTHAPAVVVQNQGGAAVVLDAGATRLEIGMPPLATPLAAPVVVPSQGSALLRFTDLLIPGGYPPGPAAVVLTLGGLENGAPYAAVRTVPDSIRVEAAATLVVLPGSTAPDSVAIGQHRSFSLVIANNGGASVTLEAGTLLRLTGASGSLALALAGAPVAIPAGGQRAVDFGPAMIPPELGPGLATGEIAAELMENGLPAARVIPVPDPVTVELPSALRFVAQSLVPARVTRGEPAAFALTLANDGQAAVAIQAGSRFRVADGGDELLVVYPGPPLAIPGNGIGALALPPAIVPPDLAAQSYAPMLELVVVEHAIGGVRNVQASPGELLVQSPVDARYVPGTLRPDLVTGGQVVAFQVEIENRGGATFLPAPTTRFEFGGYTALLDIARSPSIAGGATDTLFFLPEMVASAEAGVFMPQVTVAGTDGNGAAVAASLPLAPDAITVVRGAALRIERLTSTAPRGARVNRGQALGLTATVVNRGEEAVSGAELALSGPGLAGPLSAPVGALAPGDSAALLFQGAAAATPGTALVTAGLQGGTGAISGLPPVVVPALDDTLALAIEREAALRPAIALSAPAGAVDGVVSGGSLLDLAVQVANQGDAPIGNEGVVTLAVPAGYGVLGPAAQSLVPDAPIHFAVAVPPGGAPRDSLRVTITTQPLDLNSGAPAQLLAVSAAVAVTAVTPARLDLALAIVAPANAVNGVALPGQEVTVEALVSNQGQAQVVGPGRLQLRLDAALALAPGETGDQPFTAGAPVRFRVLAGLDPGPPHAIAVEMTEVPPDENTGLAAAVNRDQAEVSLATQVAGADVGGAPLAATARTLARGGEPAAVLGVTVRNPAPAGESQVLVLESIVPALLRLTATGGGTRHAELGVEGAVPPETVLGRLELRRDRADGALAAAWDVALGGPARLALADSLRAQETRSYVLLVTPALGAPGGSYALDLAGSGAFGLRDVRAQVPVGATVLGGELRSAVFTLFESVQVVPNPFAPERELAAIAYVLESDASVAIEIFTLLGDRVWSRAITAGEVGGRAGLNEVAWDGRNTAGQPVRNGVYHCRIRGGDVDRMVKIAAIR